VLSSNERLAAQRGLLLAILNLPKALVVPLVDEDWVAGRIGRHIALKPGKSKEFGRGLFE